MSSMVFDIEANGWRDEADTVWCVCMTSADIQSKTLQFGPDTIVSALAVLAEYDTLIGHNIINYDLPLLERLYGWKPSESTEIVDTVVMSRVLKSDRRKPLGCSGKSGPHSLEAWGYRVGRGKPDHSEWDKYSEEMLHRCSEDVAINVLVYKELMRERQELMLDIGPALDLEHSMARIITQQEINGVPFDEDNANTLRSELQVGILDIDEDIVPTIPEVPLPKSKQGTWPKKQFKKDGSTTANALRYYGPTHTVYRTDAIIKTAPINLGSDKQVKQHLLSIGWVPTQWNYKKDPVTGKPLRDLRGNKIQTSPKLTEDSYDSLSSDLGKTIGLRLKMAHRLSLVEGLIKNVRPDRRISAQAIPMGTPTGRMTHRVVVNIPGKGAYLGQELRSLFTTVPGYTRVGIDLKSCQLHGLCHYMEDADYQKAVLEGSKEDGTSAHDLARDRAGLSTYEQGKKFNYTVLFGGGDEEVARSLGLSVTEASHARRQFFERMPKLDELIRTLEKQWKALGCLKGLDGRPIWCRAKHALLVYLMQDLEAVVIKTFMSILIEIADDQGIDYQLVTTMHDEVQFLVKCEHVEQFNTLAQWSIDRVNEQFELKCPQAIDITVGKTWAETH